MQQLHGDISNMQNKDYPYPFSFSKRLMETQLSTIGAKQTRTKSRSSSLTAFERAKLMMRLRGGNDATDALDKDQRKIEKKCSAKNFERSGKYLYTYLLCQFL
jgi:hypothetical protein